MVAQRLTELCIFDFLIFFKFFKGSSWKIQDYSINFKAFYDLQKPKASQHNALSDSMWVFWLRSKNTLPRRFERPQKTRFFANFKLRYFYEYKEFLGSVKRVIKSIKFSWVWALVQHGSSKINRIMHIWFFDFFLNFLKDGLGKIKIFPSILKLF